MIVTQKLSEEIEKLLPQAQRQLTAALQEDGTILLPRLSGEEISGILRSVGDIGLLVRNAKNTLR